MVKKLTYDFFCSKLSEFYKNSKDKHSVYLTMKRIYEEKFKYKRSTKCRKQRAQNRQEQEKTNAVFNILVRAKLKKERIHTIVTPNDLEAFHKGLSNILTLNFMTDDDQKKEKKKIIKKTISKTQKRKIKRLKKIKAKAESAAEEKENKMEVDKI